MSSYLLYFGIGEFERLKGKVQEYRIKRGDSPGKIRLGENALDYWQEVPEIL